MLGFLLRENVSSAICLESASKRFFFRAINLKHYCWNIAVTNCANCAILCVIVLRSTSQYLKDPARICRPFYFPNIYFRIVQSEWLFIRRAVNFTRCKFLQYKKSICESYQLIRAHSHKHEIWLLQLFNFAQYLPMKSQI